VNQFQSDVKYLRDLTAQIDDYSGSGKSAESSRIESKVSKVLAQVEEKKSELDSLKPKLAQVRNAVNDQERYKKLLNENIDILGACKRIDELKKEISRLEEDLSKVEGRETAYAKHADAKHRKEKAMADQARIEGRWGGIVEHIRSLKVCVIAGYFRGSCWQSHLIYCKYSESSCQMSIETSTKSVV